MCRLNKHEFFGMFFLYYIVHLNFFFLTFGREIEALRDSFWKQSQDSPFSVNRSKKQCISWFHKHHTRLNRHACEGQQWYHMWTWRPSYQILSEITLCGLKNQGLSKAINNSILKGKNLGSSDQSSLLARFILTF
jgi:hypothetical protein